MSKSTFIVEVETTSYMEVAARDADHARSIVERRLPTEFRTGATGRSVTIVSVEEA